MQACCARSNESLQLANLFIVDDSFKGVLSCADLRKDQLRFEKVIDGLLIVLSFHVADRIHLCFVAFDLNHRQLVDCTGGFGKELVSRDARLFEALQVVDAQSVGVLARCHAAVLGHSFSTRKSRCVLLHLHGVGPV